MMGTWAATYMWSTNPSGREVAYDGGLAADPHVGTVARRRNCSSALSAVPPPAMRVCPAVLDVRCQPEGLAYLEADRRGQ
jgi:hypothetical protein